VVQRAIVNVIEPILDHQFHERSFGFRHGCGAHDALRIVEQKIQEGYVYVVDADLKGYFDTIPKDRLLDLVKEHISDSRMLKLIKLFLDQDILEELHINEEDEIVISGDNQSWGFLCSYLIEKSRTQWD
jgi:RNA-directed DNA polymerase